jgi:hypothetical protein
MPPDELFHNPNLERPWPPIDVVNTEVGVLRVSPDVPIHDLPGLIIDDLAEDSAIAGKLVRHFDTLANSVTAGNNPDREVSAATQYIHEFYAGLPADAASHTYPDRPRNWATSVRDYLDEINTIPGMGEREVLLALYLAGFRRSPSGDTLLFNPAVALAAESGVPPGALRRHLLGNPQAKPFLSDVKRNPEDFNFETYLQIVLASFKAEETFILFEDSKGLSHSADINRIWASLPNLDYLPSDTATWSSREWARSDRPVFVIGKFDESGSRPVFQFRKAMLNQMFFENSNEQLPPYIEQYFSEVILAFAECEDIIEEGIINADLINFIEPQLLVSFGFGLDHENNLLFMPKVAYLVANRGWGPDQIKSYIDALLQGKPHVGDLIRWPGVEEVRFDDNELFWRYRGRCLDDIIREYRAEEDSSKGLGNYLLQRYLELETLTLGRSSTGLPPDPDLIEEILKMRNRQN